MCSQKISLIEISFFITQNSGTWSRLEQHKPLFAEPRGKGDFVEVCNSLLVLLLLLKIGALEIKDVIKS